jgi:membrane-associated phospholipid phosphatase
VKRRSITRRAAASLAGLVGFVVLAVLVVAHPGPLPLDRSLHRFALDHRGPVNGAAAVVSDLGTLPVLLPLLLLAALVAARRTGRWWVVLLAPAMLFAGQAVRYLSMVTVDRPRPPPADWARYASGESFPSGHTTTSALAYSLLLLLLAPSLRSVGHSRRLPVPLLAAGLLGVAALVGLSRVVLGVHWPTDVLGGWSLALFLVPIAAWLLQRVEASRPRFERVEACPDPTPAAPTSSAPSASPAASRRIRSDRS